MAGKPKLMSQIKQLLRLYEKGEGKKMIARSLGMSRNTVKVYLHKLATGQWDMASLLAMEDADLERLFHAGNPSYKEERYDLFKEQFDYFLAELKRKGVTKRLLWEEYRTTHGSGYSYSQFCFHLSQHQKASSPSMVLSHLAGEKLYIDFAGKTMSYIDHSSGELISCQLFVACLPYSGYSFVIAVPSQSLEDFLHALGCCFEAIGGVPQVVVPDNLKAAITKADRYEPEVNRALDDFANHYGCLVIPTRVRKPKDKALVENLVRMTYTHICARLRHAPFFSLYKLNEAIRQKTKLLNQTRMQQKPFSREEKFLAEEKHLLRPLPVDKYEIKYYNTYKVAKNNHILLTQDRHYYSVPFALIGQKVQVVYTRSLVKIYHQSNQVAAHVRNYMPGVYTTAKEHLCSHHQHYLDRSPEYYIRQADKKSAKLRELFEQIFAQDKHPEQLYRICDGILRVARKAEVAALDAACHLAIQNRHFSYPFIKNIIENKMTDQQEPSPGKALPDHQNIRGKDYYTQLSLDL